MDQARMGVETSGGGGEMSRSGRSAGAAEIDGSPGKATSATATIGGVNDNFAASTPTVDAQSFTVWCCRWQGGRCPGTGVTMHCATHQQLANSSRTASTTSWNRPRGILALRITHACAITPTARRVTVEK